MNYIEEILKETGILCAMDITDKNRGVLSFCEVGGTSAIVLVINEKAFNFAIEIFPHNEHEDICSQEFNTFGEALTAFKLLITYRNLAVLPVVKTLTESI